MGNCQAVDAAALVIQHPGGKVERHYWPIPASEVMGNNPGHYVSLIIPLPVTNDGCSKQGDPPEKRVVRYTRVKLLRPTDTLVLGHAYRLITAQEVMKVLRAKKNMKMKKSEPGSAEKQNSGGQKGAGRSSEMSNTNQLYQVEEKRATVSTNPAALGRTKSWRPSLQSISEAGS